MTVHVNGIYAGSAEVQDGKASLIFGTTFLRASNTALNTVQIRMTDADGAYLAEQSVQTDSRGRSWNPWETAVQADTGSTVYSNFATFTAKELGISAVVKGDVNADGVFDLSDLVLTQKWLLAVPGAHLANWKAADLYEDDVLDVFDLSLMKRELLAQRPYMCFKKCELA